MPALLSVSRFAQQLANVVIFMCFL